MSNVRNIGETIIKAGAHPLSSVAFTLMSAGFATQQYDLLSGIFLMKAIGLPVAGIALERTETQSNVSLQNPAP